MSICWPDAARIPIRLRCEQGLLIEFETERHFWRKRPKSHWRGDVFVVAMDAHP